MKIVVYGLTVTSSWGNGHATTWRSLLRALARLGHRVHFVEKDVEWYRNNRDLPDPDFCTVHLYDEWLEEAEPLLQLSDDADAIVLGSYFPDAVATTRELAHRGVGPLLFYDIDTPITLAQLRAHGRAEYLEPDLIPAFACYLSFTGGPVLRELQDVFGSPRAIPFYCSVDPDTYQPVQARKAFACDLSYLGTYAADRQAKLALWLDGAAACLADQTFIVAGPQYPAGVAWQNNVRRIIHLSPREHPAFYSSSRFTLNLTRADMIAAGYSPSVRLFEASACGAAILSDPWPGLEQFFTPGEEILLPQDEREVCDILLDLSDAERVRIGGRARERILAEHTSQHRARQFEEVIAGCSAQRPMAERAETPA